MIQAPPLAGVVGWPIDYSRSPRLHGHWLRRYDIDGYYIPIGLPPGSFEAGLLSLPRLGFRGVNVTIPHKEAALALADTASERATAIGAANTLTFDRDGRIAADNTDGYGFIANLRQQAPGWSAAAGPALVLGAGGSARAIIHALLADGAPYVRISNRTGVRAAALRGHFGSRIIVVDWPDAPAAAAGAATIVNATSVGLGLGPVAAFDLSAAPRTALVADLVYGDEPTPFVAAAAQHGLFAVDGLGMLLHQAATGFEAWFGRRPEIDAELRAAVMAP